MKTEFVNIGQIKKPHVFTQGFWYKSDESMSYLMISFLDSEAFPDSTFTIYIPAERPDKFRF